MLKAFALTRRIFFLSLRPKWSREALVEDGILLRWWSSFPFTNIRTYHFSGVQYTGHIPGGSAMHSLSSELWIPGGNGRKNLTSSFICNGISDCTTPIYLCLSKCKNLKQTSELQFCFPQKFYKQTPIVGVLARNLNLRKRRSMCLGSLLCRTITFHVFSIAVQSFGTYEL